MKDLKGRKPSYNPFIPWTKKRIRELLRAAYIEASKSHDPSTQNGALLVTPIGTAFAADHNRFPDGVVETPERLERPLKYEYVEHAERNVIFRIARLGISAENLIMVCPWAPCADCARAIIQTGIKELITHKQAHDRSPERWREQIDRAVGMLKEGAVKFTAYDGKIGDVIIRHNGELWRP